MSSCFLHDDFGASLLMRSQIKVVPVSKEERTALKYFVGLKELPPSISQETMRLLLREDLFQEQRYFS